ncbi:MAG: DNA-formamidopyrimidine glycosylase family protein, partial [Candidatus Omnitrophota bacterium]|nr:DNA-formamidopyrimidine glycosylase family protein [Candidatus Omnitrophota bacterium]
MPELPEVETIRRDLIRVLNGKKIVDVFIVDKHQIQSHRET